MDSNKSDLRWGVAQRLEFVEFRLFWEGHVNRSDLIEQCGLSVNQASADLNRYIGVVPDNMVCDKSARTYVRGPDYAAQFLKPDASRYLAQLRSLAIGIMDSDDAEDWQEHVTLERLGLGTDPSARKSQDQQIVLSNRGLVLGRPEINTYKRSIINGCL